MSDPQARLDGFTVQELRAFRRGLYEAKSTGTLSVQYGDGTRVQYRSMTEITEALRDIDGRISAGLATLDSVQNLPVRAFRMRPWNGYY